MDVLAAIASALGVELYHLFVPGLDPQTHPPVQADAWIEAEVARRLASRLRLSKASKLRLEDDLAKTSGGPHSNDPFVDSKTSIGSTPRGPSSEAKTAIARASTSAKKPNAPSA